MVSVPDGMPMQERATLYEWSRQVEWLNFFLSHCWAGDGFQKYVVLLVHLFGELALFSMVAVSGGIFFLTTDTARNLACGGKTGSGF